MPLGGNWKSEPKGPDAVVLPEKIGRDRMG